MRHTIEFDPELIKKYDTAGPRYTSYPTAVQFSENFGEREYLHFAQQSNTGDGARPLSLYVHIPFCATVCFYCACNKIVTKNRARAVPYLESLFREIELQGGLFDRGRGVEQLHWGGGTPTFLSHAQMRALMAKTAEHFSLRADDGGEYSIEVDPREADAPTVAVLRELGFNRLSLGVQDFDPRVQAAVNRIQTETQTFEVMAAARAEDFKSINVDLIYGLPHQNVESFGRTLDKVVEAEPDRLSIFNYAHLPDMFKPQRRIDAATLPAPAEKLKLLQLTIDRLGAAGYVYIGMDHFAKPGDELAVAQRNGGLYRNFQGYSTRAECDLIAMGTTAIGKIGDCYSQNLRTTDAYGARLASHHLPIMRGLALDADDLLRRAVIMELICHFRLDINSIERRFQIAFADYFVAEVEALAKMQEDGLLSMSESEIRVSPAGKLLIRNICMAFDRYLRENRVQRYSKVI